MSGGNVLPDWTAITSRSVPELLEEARTLFEHLAAAGRADEHQAAKARLLRMITAVLTERAARLGPPETSACTCGQTFGTPEELDDHFMETFIPDDGLAPDGYRHVEA